MPTVQEGDVLLLSREGVIRHFDSALNFIQIKYILTQEEYNYWNDGLVNDDNANMFIQVGSEIFVAMPGHQCVGILDLDLNRIDTFLNPFRGDIAQAEGAVISIAYHNSVLYVCSRDDYDYSGTGDRISIAAYSWPSRGLLWRSSPAYNRTSITVPANRAFFNVTTWIKLSPDGSTLYVVDRGYGVGFLNTTTQEFTPLHYIDAVHPTYFNDSINQSDPPGFFPDVTQLHYYPDLPRQFITLTDGTEGPVSEGVPATEGNKINTIAFHRYFGVGQPDNSDAQLQVRATSVDVDNNGKIYVQVNQLGSTQGRQISNYPSAPNFWGILSQQYSPEHYVVVLNSNGTFDRRILLPIHTSEEVDVNHYRSGYLFGHFNAYGNNAPHGVSVTRDGSYAYSVQIAGTSTTKGAGPLTKINLATDEATYYGELELVPRWAVQELNDGLFRESTPSYRHVLPITFIAPPVLDLFFPFVTLIGAN